jgi:hypothetical protein
MARIIELVFLLVKRGCNLFGEVTDLPKRGIHNFWQLLIINHTRDGLFLAIQLYSTQARDRLDPDDLPREITHSQ